MSHKAMGATSPMCDLLVVRCSNIFCALHHSRGGGGSCTTQTRTFQFGDDVTLGLANEEDRDLPCVVDGSEGEREPL